MTIVRWIERLLGAPPSKPRRVEVDLPDNDLDRLNDQLDLMGAGDVGTPDEDLVRLNKEVELVRSDTIKVAATVADAERRARGWRPQEGTNA